MKLALDKALLANAKSEDEKLIIIGDAILAESAKSALNRDNEALVQLEKRFTDQLTAFEQRVAERFPKLSMPGVEHGDDKSKDKYSIARAAAYAATGDASIAPYELSVHNAMRQKAMSFGIDTAGGFIVPSEVMGGLIDKLYAAMIGKKCGVRMIDGGTAAPIRRNRKTGTSTATWVGEGQVAAKSQISLGQMELSPKAISAQTDISNLLQLLSSGAAEQMAVDDFAQQFALGFDRAIFLGAPPKGPIGAVNTPGVGTSSGASLTYDKLVDFELALMAANALFAQPAWACSVSKYGEIYKLKDSANQPIVYRDVQVGGPNRVLGYPIYPTTALGTTGAQTLNLGVWSTAMLVQWFGGMILKATDTSDNALDNDTTRVVGRMYGDVGVEQPTAVVASSD